MVERSLKSSIRGRGRPSKDKVIIDLGTPEQQIKRNSLLSLLNFQKEISPIIAPKALSGSFLHQQFSLGHIDQKQLRTGLICRKTFLLASRSMGIRTRLSSASQKWGEIRGFEEDHFENREIEEKWKKLRTILFEIKNDSPLNHEIINLILFDNRHLCDITQFTSIYFANALQSALDEIGKMINKLKRKKFIH